MLNGVLLALFGLIQFFTSPHHVLYWTFPSAGQVFGPFICRDHFPFYINMCFGLGLGLLWSSKSLNTRIQSSKGRARSLPIWLSHPQVLGIGAALALMLSSLAVCLSRGGMLAFVSGGLVCLIIQLAPHPVFWTALWASGPDFGYRFDFLVWNAPVEARLATFWQGRALEDRVPIWSRTLILAKEFPVWGTGLGTFQYVEPCTAPG